jgi:hypothetical protein
VLSFAAISVIAGSDSSFLAIAVVSDKVDILAVDSGIRLELTSLLVLMPIFFVP